MHPAGHRIEIDPDREFMRVTLWGDWANAQTDGLAVDHAKAVLQMKARGARHGHFLTLVDMREKLLTEAVTVAEFRKSFEANSPSRRTAIIVSPPLPTSMAERIAPPGRVLITYTEEEALAWLFDDV
ncbi:hypothetical protein [Sphingomonas sp. NFX23]|jgi:hypothetical protein|uniref:hypothetical protein n=1 Tax=Sphingomonas sp. NFX23 TaxID=2819532 RepID=UPI003CF80FCF